MEREVRIGHRETTFVVSRRMAVRLSEIGAVMGAAFGQAYGFISSLGIEAHGPPFVIYHEKPVGDDPFEIEICAPIAVPVAVPVEPPPGWQLQELPPGMFVTLLHVGPYDTVGAAYEAVVAWIGAHDLVVAGPPREVYLSEPETPSDQVRTIVEFPVTGAAVPADGGG